jgi:hypothetical protein
MGNLVAKQSTIRLSFKITSAHGMVTPEADLNVRLQGLYTTATSIYQTTGTITGGVDTIDLRGALIDDLGDPVTFQKVHLVHFKHADSGSNITFRPTFPILGSSAQTITLASSAYNTYIDEAGVVVPETYGNQIHVTGTTGLQYKVIVVGRKPA